MEKSKNMTQKQLTQIFEQNFDKVFGYFYRRLTVREDVEDLTLVSLKIFLEKITDEKTEIQKPQAYLWSICHSQLVHFIKNKSKKPVSLDLSEEKFEFKWKIENTESLSFKNRMTKLQKCMQKVLSQTDFEIVNSCILDGVKAVEVGQKIDLKPATVRQKLKRSLDKIRKQCKKIWLGYENF